ncbi:unnamed protein product [Arabidopsis arenosa]|uniref:PUM-HD domain-containing protein n=1 Tax=Arabidopsis arenosa TaxID=38785 RepID=A0A8S1ZX61_ARAAE|nr:unnamed protein product [Arabidopsis arenosa]
MAKSKLTDYSGYIASIALNPKEIGFFCERIQVGDVSEVDAAFFECVHFVHQLATDETCSICLKKLAEKSFMWQRFLLLDLLTKGPEQLTKICLDKTGCSSLFFILGLDSCDIQKQELVTRLALVFKQLLLSDPRAVEYLLRHLVESVGAPNFQPLQLSALECVLDLAKDPCGYHNLISLIRLGIGRDALVQTLGANAAVLSTDRIGNFLVQSLLNDHSDDLTNSFFANMAGKFVAMSFNMNSYHVVQWLIDNGNPDISQLVMNEIDSSPQLSQLIINKFGNYVIQKILRKAKIINPPLFLRLSSFITANRLVFSSNPSGIHVVIECDLLRQRWYGGAVILCQDLHKRLSDFSVLLLNVLLLGAGSHLDVETQPNRHAVVGAANSLPDLCPGHVVSHVKVLLLFKDKSVVLWSIQDHIITVGTDSKSSGSIIKKIDDVYSPRPAHKNSAVLVMILALYYGMTRLAAAGMSSSGDIQTTSVAKLAMAR